MNRNEAFKAMIDGHKVRHDSFNNGAYMYFDTDHDGANPRFFYMFSHGQSGPLRGMCHRLDGYSILIDALTFDEIRESCEPMKHLLVDKDGYERLFLGFNRDNRLVTDNYLGKGASPWGPKSVKSWKIKPLEEIN